MMIEPQNSSCQGFYVYLWPPHKLSWFFLSWFLCLLVTLSQTSLVLLGLVNNVFDWFRWFGLWCLTPLSTISVISWRSVLLVEETGVPWENHWPVASHWQTLSHNVVLSTPRHERVRTLMYLFGCFSIWKGCKFTIFVLD